MSRVRSSPGSTLLALENRNRLSAFSRSLLLHFVNAGRPLYYIMLPTASTNHERFLIHTDKSLSTLAISSYQFSLYNIAIRYFPGSSVDQKKQ